MNDTALSEAVKTQLAAVRDCLSTVSSAIPASEIIARAHRRRIRRRRTILAGGAGITLGAAAAVTALALGGATSTLPVPAQLTAWTVAKQPDGNIYVHIRELHDPAGLQRTLRADGVPASVTFVGQQNPSCRPYPASLALINRVFPLHQGASPSVVVIHPSALPSRHRRVSRRWLQPATAARRAATTR